MSALVRTSPFRFAVASAAFLLLGFAVAADTRTFTRAADIRSLTPEQAKAAYAVHVRGIITDDSPKPDFFVQDGSAGIYVEGSPQFVHRLGDVIDVIGTTAPGHFAPVIHESSSRVVGHRALPPAKFHSFREFASGEMDSQWMQVRGIVRFASIDKRSWREPTLAMELSSAEGRFRVRVPIDHEPDVREWVGREVSLTGVCGSLWNAERQLNGILFYVPRLSFVQLAPPPQRVAITELLRFSPGPGGNRRVRVQGAVLYQQPGKVLYIANGNQGLRVFTDQTTRVPVGSTVDVSGIPATGESAPVLQEATFWVTGKGTMPAVKHLVFAAPLERFDGSLVEIQGTVIQKSLDQLLLQNGANVFAAVFDTNGRAAWRDILPGTLISVTGICLVRSGGLWSVPESVRVLVRRPEDLRVLQSPPWWTESHSVWALVAVLVALAAVSAWGLLLKRRVREQREVINRNLRDGAILEERNRIARELHDTLEQHLAGITMQLDVAAHCFRDAPAMAERAVDQARNMTRHSMLEARRSVWDLRCHLLESGDLGSALQEIIKPWNGAEETKVSLEVKGTPLRLPSRVELNLLRIGQEAVANAVKHAQAKCVLVQLEYDDDAARLQITDDGKGFDAANPKTAPDGHFGFLDMRERAQSLGSDLRIESKPGSGTRVAVDVRLEEELANGS